MKKQKKSHERRLWIGVVVGIVILIVLVMFFFPKQSPGRLSVESLQTACSLDRAPVCGVDAKTYTNRCTAEKTYNVRVAYDGACNVTSTEEKKPTQDSGAVVDSGIEDLWSVPKYMQDRPDSGGLRTSDQTESVSAGSGLTQSGQNTISYSNNAFHYGFDIPKHSYYTAFGAQDGANHTVGISMSVSGSETLSGSEIRVYFYSGKILDRLKNAENGFATDPATGDIYLLLGEKNSVRIESSNPESEIVKTIVRTIHMTE